MAEAILEAVARFFGEFKGEVASVALGAARALALCGRHQGWFVTSSIAPSSRRDGFNKRPDFVTRLLPNFGEKGSGP